MYISGLTFDAANSNHSIVSDKICTFPTSQFYKIPTYIFNYFTNLSESRLLVKVAEYVIHVFVRSWVSTSSCPTHCLGMNYYVKAMWIITGDDIMWFCSYFRFQDMFGQRAKKWVGVPWMIIWKNIKIRLKPIQWWKCKMSLTRPRLSCITLLKLYFSVARNLMT